MYCKDIELTMPEGYKKDVTVCKNVKGMPKRTQGITVPSLDLVLINEYLEYPELYVELHEINHILHPDKSEYEIRRISDFEYRKLTGYHIDTANEYLEYMRRASQKRWN